MTSKTSYTHEEWATLLKAPFYAGSCIGAADVHHIDQRKERKTMVKEATLWTIPDEARDLIRPLYSDIGKFREDTEQIPGYEEEINSDNWKPEALERLSEVIKILEAKATDEEVAAFKEWVMYVAEKTAEAGKEGALGLVGPRVSEKEQAALDEIRQALDPSE